MDAYKVASIVSDFDSMDCSPTGSLSTVLSRQEHWSELPSSPPGYLPYPGIEPTSPTLAGRFFITSTTWKPE